MKRIALGIVMTAALGTVAVPAQAQVLSGERPPMDSLTQTYHDAIIEMRDTLLSVNAAVNGLTRGMTNTSAPVVAQRVRQLGAVCGSASATAESLVSSFDSTHAREALADEVANVARALAELSGSLQAECVGVFNDRFAAATDSLQNWAPYYSRQVEALPRAFLNAAYGLAHSANFRIEARYSR